jgi:putative transposase
MCSIKMRSPSHRQLDLPLRSWGGKRKGAGRKPKPGARRRVAHVTRPPHCPRHPVHITLRIRSGLPSLRTQVLSQIVRRALGDTRRCSFRVAQYSIQSNHLHLLVESDSRDALAQGVAGLSIRVAQRLNAILVRRGSVFADRYHRRSLETPREVRTALVYVLLNLRRHGGVLDGIDPLSSGLAFDGWADAVSRAPPTSALRDRLGVRGATTWLLSRGWRRHGLIRTSECPAMGRARA